MEDKYIIENTIRVTFYNDYARMRLFDYLFKHKCFPKGSGVLNGKSYLIFDADELLFHKENFYNKTNK